MHLKAPQWPILTPKSAVDNSSTAKRRRLHSMLTAVGWFFCRKDAALQEIFFTSGRGQVAPFWGRWCWKNWWLQNRPGAAVILTAIVTLLILLLYRPGPVDLDEEWLAMSCQASVGDCLNQKVEEIQLQISGLRVVWVSLGRKSYAAQFWPGSTQAARVALEIRRWRRWLVASAPKTVAWWRLCNPKDRTYMHIQQRKPPKCVSNDFHKFPLS